MPFHRRDFLKLMAGGVAAGILAPATLVGAAEKPAIKAIAFDAFPIFDPRPVFGLAESLFPGKGAILSKAWRTRQFEYQWLRALSGQYADFWQATEEALVFAAKSLNLDLTPEKRQRLMGAYLELKTWPDVPRALESLKEAGIRLAFLSNMTQGMLEANIKHAGLEGIFEQVLSTDREKTYKPDPQAYQIGVDALGLKREEIVFTAFAGWDVAGAKWFGYPTFWVNRLNFPPEEFGVVPDGVGRDLTALVDFVGIS